MCACGATQEELEREAAVEAARVAQAAQVSLDPGRTLFSHHPRTNLPGCVSSLGSSRRVRVSADRLMRFGQDK